MFLHLILWMNADYLSLVLEFEMRKFSHPHQKVQKTTAASLLNIIIIIIISWLEIRNIWLFTLPTYWITPTILEVSASQSSFEANRLLLTPTNWMWQADFEEEDDVDFFKHHGVERFLFPLRHLHAGQARLQWRHSQTQLHHAGPVRLTAKTLWRIHT